MRIFPMNKDKAQFNPASVYQHPHDVTLDDTLTPIEKLDILKRWAYDENEIYTAEQENMSPKAESAHSLLDQINAEIIELEKQVPKIKPR